MSVSRRPGRVVERREAVTALAAGSPVMAGGSKMPLSIPSIQWRIALLTIAIAICVLGFVFKSDVTLAVRVWIASTAYNHCFLILPLVGFLLWERRAVIAAVSPRPALWPLVMMLPLS